MNIGYVRVSAKDQNEEMQIAEINKYCAARNDKIDDKGYYIDKKSGENIENRPKFNEMLKFVRSGDTIFFYDYDRFARDTVDLITTVDDLQKKGVTIVCLQRNIDTRTPEGRLMLTILAGIAEFERSKIRERQKHGIENAKRKGKHIGRPWIEPPKEFEKVYKIWKEGKITAEQAFTSLGLRKNTFYSMVKAHEKGIDRKKLSKNYLKVI